MIISKVIKDILMMGKRSEFKSFVYLENRFPINKTVIDDAIRFNRFSTMSDYNGFIFFPLQSPCRLSHTYILRENADSSRTRR